MTVQQKKAQSPANLKWYETLELVSMALYIISVAIHWRLGIWALALLILVAIVKMVASHKVGNPILTKASRICLLSMVLYFLVYFISIHYSSSPLGGITASGKKIPLLVLPLFFLLSDLSYIRRKNVFTMGLLIALVLTIRFCIMMTQAVLNYVSGTPFAQVIHFHFDPMHYNYLALYILTAIIILSFEAIRHWDSPRWRIWRWTLVVDIMMLIEYILMVCSRSGLLTLLMIAAATTGYLILLKKYRPAIIVPIAFVLFLGLNYITMPRLFSRAQDTIEEMEAGEDGDVRQDIWECAWELVDDHKTIGYGNDGYWVELYRQYVKHDLQNCYKKDKLNIHNQYLETFVATGAVGLIVLLFMVGLPALLSVTRRNWNPIMVFFTLAYALWIFFEEAFSRQMGLLFICWWYGFFLTFGHYYLPTKD